MKENILSEEEKKYLELEELLHNIVQDEEGSSARSRMNSGLLHFRSTWSESYFVNESGGEEGPGTSLDDVVQINCSSYLT